MEDNTKVKNSMSYNTLRASAALGAHELFDCMGRSLGAGQAGSSGELEV